jgi:hypothetical protein
MAVTITHAKTNNIPDPTQAELDAQIALGNYPIGTTLADIALASDWNAVHVVTGAGDVEGPASSTDNAIARYDGTTGKLIQNSSVTIDDSGNIAATNLSGTNTGDQTITLTGDVTGSGTGSFAATLATVNSNVGTFGSATQVAQVTLDGKGRATAASNVTITPAASSVTGGQALTRTNDTNVTLTLGGTPTTALLQATSITVGWSGRLEFSRVAQLSANSVLGNQTTSAADGASITLAANTVLGRGTGGNVDDLSIGFGLISSVSDIRINLAETKVDWTGDHTWRDDLHRLYNPAGTLMYHFRTSAISARRDVTLPLLTGNDTFVFEAHTQTLTNKTLTSPTITGGTINNTQIGNTTPTTANFGSTTNYWNFASDGTMSPVNPTNVAPFKLGVDMYAFNVTGTFAGVFFRFAGTFLPGVAGYVFPDLFGGDVASVDVAANESFVNAAYGYAGAVATPTQIVANTNDWALLANNAGQFLRISSDAARTVTGIGAPSTANRGVSKRLVNIGSFNMSFTHQDAASTASNRMITSTAGTIVLPPNGQLDIWYDYVSSRWRISLMN